ncbi:MAG: CooT family nickel-binding protein [Thermofilum sp.]
MCESKVIIRIGSDERTYEEVAYLGFEGGRITLIDIEGRKHVIEGFARVVRIDANFVKHTVQVVLE